MGDKWKKQTENILILSDDCFLLFHRYDEHSTGKLLFWASLYNLASVKLCNTKSIIDFIFKVENNEICSKKQFTLMFSNLLNFKEELLKRQKKLAVRIENVRIVEGKEINDLVSEDEVNQMMGDELSGKVKIMFDEIINDDFNVNVVKSFLLMCRRVKE